PAEREQPQPDRVAGQAGEFRMGPRLVVDLDPAHTPSLSSASIPRCKTAISTARQHRSWLSPRLAAQRETASRSRCSSSTGTRIAVRHGESAGMPDTGELTLSLSCARVSMYVGLYLLIVGYFRLKWATRSGRSNAAGLISFCATTVPPRPGVARLRFMRCAPR